MGRTSPLPARNARICSKLPASESSMLMINSQRPGAGVSTWCGGASLRPCGRGKSLGSGVDLTGIHPAKLPPVPPSLQQRQVKTGGRLVKHARYYWLLLAEGHLTRRVFAAILPRIWALPLPAG